MDIKTLSHYLNMEIANSLFQSVFKICQTKWLINKAYKNNYGFLGLPEAENADGPNQDIKTSANVGHFLGKCIIYCSWWQLIGIYLYVNIYTNK